MQTYNAVLGSGSRWAAGLKRLLGMQDAGLQQLAPELQAGLDLGAMPPELRYPCSEMLAGLTYPVAAGGAGTWAGIQFGCPAAARTMAVVESIIAWCTEGIRIYPLQIGGITTGIRGAFRDGRAQVGTAATAQYGCQSAGLALQPTYGMAFVSANWYFTEPIVVTPGRYLWLLNDSENDPLVVSIAWRERAMFEMEG